MIMLDLKDLNIRCTEDAKKAEELEMMFFRTIVNPKVDNPDGSALSNLLMSDLNDPTNHLNLKERLFKEMQCYLAEIKLLDQLQLCLQDRPQFKNDVIDFLYRDAQRNVIIEKYKF